MALNLSSNKRVSQTVDHTPYILRGGLPGRERLRVLSRVQLAATRGEVKLITMENIADAVESEGLATRAELERLTDELYEFAHTPGTIGCLPRVVEAWGYARSKEN